MDADICLARDQDGRTPLHLAAIKGHVDVLGKLVEAKPIATRILLDRRETILQLCVKHNHLEALKMLVEDVGTQRTPPRGLTPAWKAMVTISDATTINEFRFFLSHASWLSRYFSQLLPFEGDGCVIT
ncbi:hypothetical protein HHK36_014350 [Tetracentron sinense]|uniref:Uncharacterized protein n=1 Tax=Tetracentron sinense TaxID=13715 RepID=A0A834ZEN5_TETSI|nr:hypothetical protein HHK36_014350 [Tetracentron sinense]